MQAVHMHVCQRYNRDPASLVRNKGTIAGDARYWRHHQPQIIQAVWPHNNNDP